MTTMKTLLVALLILALAPLNAQTADEIINNYFENTGGLENWKNLNSIKFNGELNVNQMVLPIEMIQMKKGNTITKANIQGQDFFKDVFDGETLWGSNQTTMALEKSDSETTNNYKNEMNDFPDPFIDYKEKGYVVELIGNETIEGTETFKIKLTKEPIKVDGVITDDISYYYFESENFVPIVIEKEMKSGPGKGMVLQLKYSDYEEVDGMYFAFSINQGVKDLEGNNMMISMKTIELNPEIDMTVFDFPEATVITEEGK